jgi:hypothetical protein
MNLRSRVARLTKAADPVVVRLRCMGRRAFTRGELADYVFGTPLDGAHPLRHLIADAYSEAVFRGISDAELEVYAQDDGPELPFREDMAEAGERAVRDLDAAIARGKHPGLAEDVAAWHRAREDRR